MKISDLYKEDKTILSFEVFPPKKTSPIESVYGALEELCSLKPAYISVTYGAGGTAADNTCAIAAKIKHDYNIEPIAHITCVNSSKAEVEASLDSFKANDIENVLALRGDIVPDMEPKTDFKYASELTEFIKKKGGFHIAGACYPEVHPEAKDEVSDIINLKKKVDAGAEFLISQLFYDNRTFYEFEKRCRLAGINVPIEAGIMPVINTKQIQRMVSLCGASLPAKFVRIMNRYENNPEALREAGIAYAVDQCVDLIANGVSGIHLYTMNNPYVARRITEAVDKLL
ncbi:MAG: methylenetetrahydrofolate reductase [NAD(P)H] [Ruminococcus sp.]|jgi:methylenetetrahydrofolate reductase (NADPH)|nr:methylenetetrahydrofolate reductase [NAD(P)H] [Ruminococcus sp.]